MANNRKNPCKDLVPFNYHITDINLTLPETPHNRDKRTCTRVKNAWVNFTHMDDEGVIWVDVQRVSDILRTTDDKVRYEIGNLREEDVKRYGERLFIKGYKLSSLLDEYIQKEKPSKRKDYLLYSERIYKEIRDCETAEILRIKYIDNIAEERKKLKKLRIKKYNVKVDELTGEKLRVKTAEFSHIRSASIFKELALELENGLIVNKETHKIITMQGICDERELLNLCKEKGWNMDWYRKFMCYFNLE